MKLYIDRGHCELCQSYCDRHIAKLVRFPLGEDRPCLEKLEDDGETALTLVITDGPKAVTLVLSELEREIIGLEGLSTFLPWTTPAPTGAA